MKNIRFDYTAYYRPLMGLHRIGMAAVEYKVGYKKWCFRHKFHKINGVWYYELQYLNSLYSLYGNRIKINTGRLVI